MAIEWHEASTKFKIAWVSWLIGAPVLSVIIWRLQIPYVQIYLIIIAIAAWTAAFLYKRRGRMASGISAEERKDQAMKDNNHGRVQ